MDRLLERKVIVVTGAAQGIGAAFARASAEAGAEVALCDRLAPDAVVAELRAAGHTVLGGCFDATEAGALAAFLLEVEHELGPVEGLVNNAALFGHLGATPFHELTSREFADVLTTNVSLVFEPCKAVAPLMMRRRSGRIVNIASTVALSGAPMLMHYVASKGAVLAMTRSMARELGPYGIGVNAVAPGLTASQSVTENPAMNALHATMVPRRAFQRQQTPADLTGAVIFLLSDASAFMTGQTVIVDGGTVMI